MYYMHVMLELGTRRQTQRCAARAEEARGEPEQARGVPARMHTVQLALTRGAADRPAGCALW